MNIFDIQLKTEILCFELLNTQKSDFDEWCFVKHDGREVKALDLSSNGQMSAWVRTPLVLISFFYVGFSMFLWTLIFASINMCIFMHINFLFSSLLYFHYVFFLNSYILMFVVWHRVKRFEIVQDKLCDTLSETKLVASKITIVKSDCYTESVGLHQISKVKLWLYQGNTLIGRCTLIGNLLKVTRKMKLFK